MKITGKDTIGKVVANDNRTAAIFKKHLMDFCCRGNISIDKACANRKMDSEQLIIELNQAIKDSSKELTDFNNWPLDELSSYIEKTHHRYCDAKISEIKPYLEKITEEHGEDHPELKEINELFAETAGEMTSHMKKEELILFPFIRKMVKNKNSEEGLPAARFGSVENPIDMMLEDHSDEGDRFHKIRALSNNYTAPEDACNVYRITFALLNEFEDDLHQHIHLENNILFPKSIELEKAFG